MEHFSVYSEQCPSRNILEAISDKWSILILTVLERKLLRFGELRREVGGISQKMLMQTLQKLEKWGFVIRKAYPILPMKVEYSLTPLGQELCIILNALTSWTETHMKEILQAEEYYLNQVAENQ